MKTASIPIHSIGAELPRYPVDGLRAVAGPAERGDVSPYPPPDFPAEPRNGRKPMLCRFAAAVFWRGLASGEADGSIVIGALDPQGVFHRLRLHGDDLDLAIEALTALRDGIAPGVAAQR